MNKVGYWLTGLTSVFCFFSLWNLYQTKQQTKLVESQIAQVQKERLAANSRTALLKMEWGVLNQPDRLEDLSKRFLPNLRPTETEQFAQLEQAGKRLPSIYEPDTLGRQIMLAGKHSKNEDSIKPSENIALARNTISAPPATIVKHEEDGGLDAAISDLAKNNTQEHIRSLPVSHRSPAREDESYHQLLTAFQQDTSPKMPNEL
ncbi:hypothetical protein FAI40_00655 [Acetobacteraceae bacterium]|nr:hypothetical protein FAI40_00655 [Acetobacteraceae bacterium]